MSVRAAPIDRQRRFSILFARITSWFGWKASRPSFSLPVSQMWWTNQEGDPIEIIAAMLGAGTRANADGDANVRGTYNSTPWYYARCRHRAPVLAWSATN
jgi:hypothetical protein